MDNNSPVMSPRAVLIALFRAKHLPDLSLSALSDEDLLELSAELFSKSSQPGVFLEDFKVPLWDHVRHPSVLINTFSSIGLHPASFIYDEYPAELGEVTVTSPSGTNTYDLKLEVCPLGLPYGVVEHSYICPDYVSPQAVKRTEDIQVAWRWSKESLYPHVECFSFRQLYLAKSNLILEVSVEAKMSMPSERYYVATIHFQTINRSNALEYFGTNWADRAISMIDSTALLLDKAAQNQEESARYYRDTAQRWSHFRQKLIS